MKPAALATLRKLASGEAIQTVSKAVLKELSDHVRVAAVSGPGVRGTPVSITAKGRGYIARLDKAAQVEDTDLSRQ